MSLVTQIPLDPTISADITAVPASLASAFRGNVNANVALIENKVQTVAAWTEQLHSLLGNGWISGGNVTIGTGLSVNIDILSAMVDHIVAFNASQAVGGLTASSTNYIYLREDGTWTVNTTGVAPTDTVAHGAALLWCTCVTSGSAVTSIDQTVRASFGRGDARFTTISWRVVSGTSDTPVLGDAGAGVSLESASATAVTLPQNSVVAFAIGTVISLRQLGAGLVTVSAGTGATVVSRVGLKSAGQYARFTAEKISTNGWLLSGDVAA